MDWTDTQVADLRSLWAEGISTAEIGRRLGCGKNAVIGKAHRMGLSRPSPIDPASRTAQARDRRVGHLEAAKQLLARGYSCEQIGRQLGINRETAGKMLRDAGFSLNGRRRHALPADAAAPGQVVVREPVAPPAPRAAHPLLRAGANGCRWPIGEPRTLGFRFCEDPAVQGKAYCGEHCALAYDRRPGVIAAAMQPRRWAA